MKNVDIIVDLQFGSTGKGLLAGYLGKKICYDTYVTSNAPNAGHTFIEADGTKWVMRQLPVGACLPFARTILVGPGAVIDPDTLLVEYEWVSAARQRMGRGAMPRLLIHPHAAVVTPAALDEERAFVKIGSTMKGAGAALMAKIRRDPDAFAIAKKGLTGPMANFVCEPREYENALDSARTVMVEGSQGYSLGINSGFYPYTTSRECTPTQIMSDCLIPWSRLNKVIGVFRMHPIRVANRFDAEGNMIGTSGPGYPDQQEITFEDLGVTPETTTVTKLRRRVFTFSMQQIDEAIRACQPAEVFLNFANYRPEQYPIIKTEVDALVALHCADIGETAGVRYVGWGPKESDVQEVSPQYTLDLTPEGKRRSL